MFYFNYSLNRFRLCPTPRVRAGGQAGMTDFDQADPKTGRLDRLYLSELFYE